MTLPPSPATSRQVTLTVLVAALGYFVDIYDLVLFLVVRLPSLRGIGVPEAELLSKGVLLLDLQMAGMLVGGFLWGILGDRRGRKSVLFGSILAYSLANLANGLVTTVPAYAVLRFVAGVGLAGELGAGVTLVSEVMSRSGRGYGTTLVAGVGLLGAVAAAVVGRLVPWQTAYFIGGGLGLALLLLRVGVSESGLYEGVRGAAELPRGSLRTLFGAPDRVRRYCALVLVGAPIWFTTSILVGLSPELARAMNMTPLPEPGTAVMVMYLGGSLGDFVSGLLSQVLRSRRRVIGLFLGLMALSIAAYFTLGRGSPLALYACAGALGLSSGYWAVFVTVAGEQFGTNLRATAATTIPNVVRGSVVPLTAAFQLARGPLGTLGSAATLGLGTLAVAALALRSVDETFGRDLDFVER